MDNDLPPPYESVVATTSTRATTTLRGRANLFLRLRGMRRDRRDISTSPSIVNLIDDDDLNSPRSMQEEMEVVSE